MYTADKNTVVESEINMAALVVRSKRDVLFYSRTRYPAITDGLGSSRDDIEVEEGLQNLDMETGTRYKSLLSLRRGPLDWRSDTAQKMKSKRCQPTTRQNA
jgi:hypothetical protein